MTALAVALIVLLAAAVFQTARHYRADEQWTLHSYQVRENILQLVNHLHVAEMEARSYGLTGRDVAFQRYWRAINEVEEVRGQLAALVQDNPAQRAAVARLQAAIAARRRQYERILDDYRNAGPATAHAEVVALVSGSAHPVTDNTDAMLASETLLLKTREANSVRTARRVAIAAAVALGGSLALLLAAFGGVRVELKRRLLGERRLARSRIELERALAAASRAGDTLRRLASLTEMLQNCHDLEEAINVVDRALPPLLPGSMGALAVLSASRNLVETRMHWGDAAAPLGDGVFAPEDCWALRRSQPHPGADDHAAPVCRHLAHGTVDATRCVCLPLNAQGQVLGVLTVVAPGPLDAETRGLAVTIADQLALALGNLQLQASLRTQSIRDPLTSLFNRRYIEASLPRELARAERRRGSLSVLMCDLDHFKRYNDTQGHDAGDALLGAFGTLLAQACRSEDIPCRFGGEEFTVILTDADHPHALARAEAIRKATAELVVRFRGGTLPPATVSIGVATYPEHGRSPEELLRMADQALYRAKHRGRNTVASTGEPATDPPPAERSPA